MTNYLRRTIDPETVAKLVRAGLHAIGVDTLGVDIDIDGRVVADVADDTVVGDEILRLAEAFAEKPAPAVAASPHSAAVDLFRALRQVDTSDRMGLDAYPIDTMGLDAYPIDTDGFSDCPLETAIVAWRAAGRPTGVALSPLTQAMLDARAALHRARGPAVAESEALDRASYAWCDAGCPDAGVRTVEQQKASPATDVTAALTRAVFALSNVVRSLAMDAHVRGGDRTSMRAMDDADVALNELGEAVDKARGGP